MMRFLLVAAHCVPVALVVFGGAVSGQTPSCSAAQPVSDVGVAPYYVEQDGVVYLEQAAPRQPSATADGYRAVMPAPTMSLGGPWAGNTQQPPPGCAPWLPFQGFSSGGTKPPVFIHRHAVFGEFLFIRPRDAGVAYALPIDGPVAPVLGNEVPVGPTAVVDPDYDPAFRAGFSVALGQGSSLAAQYTYVHTGTASAATVTAPTVLRSLVSHPLGANAATDTLDAAASLDIDLDTIDVDFRSLIYGCECECGYAVNYLLGAQWAQLDQDFASSFETIGTTTVNTAIQFDGIGMRFGMQGERYFPCSGLFVYANGTGNLLFGEFKASYQQANTFNGVEAYTSWTAGRVVPVLDLEIGVGWLGPRRHLRLSAGYRASTWLNVVKTDDWVHAVQTHDFRNLDGTLTFDGLVARAEWLF